VTALWQNGSMADLKKSGRPKSARIVASIKAVQEDVRRSPKKSARRSFNKCLFT
jgi:hypothetical protein